MTPAKEPPPFRVYGCLTCWELNSGYGPTIIVGVPHRPVAHEKSRIAVCYFCGESSAGVHRYEAMR